MADLKISLFNFNCVMIYMIYKILVLLNNPLNYLKNNILECVFKKYNRLFNFLFFFFMKDNAEKFKV